MSEVLPEDDGVKKKSSKKEDAWKEFSLEKYAKVITELVHFSSKTVNSNTKPVVGVRLTPEAALDAPYVAARTLLQRGVSLELDYAQDATRSEVCKQVNAVIRKSPFGEQASAAESTAIRTLMTKAQTTPYMAGTDAVDHRLRQILIPKDDAEGGYVAVTPITASGLCALLFDGEKGLVPLHNAACDAERTATDAATMSLRRKLRQAQFGIGGSNPHNVGGLVRSTMQRPLFVDAPRSATDHSKAFSLYHKGITVDFSRAGALRDSVQAYVEFRKQHGLDSSELPSAALPQTNMDARQTEAMLVRQIAFAVLERAADARDILTEFASVLPQETDPVTGGRALVSVQVKPAVVRALLDPALRTAAWSRDMAWWLMERLERATYKNGNKMLLLDPTATATLVGILEEALR